MRYRIYLWLSCSILAGVSVAGVLIAMFLVSQLGGSVRNMVYSLPFGLQWSGVWWFAVFPVVGVLGAAFLHQHAPESPTAVRIYSAVAIVTAVAVLVMAMLGSLTVHELV